MMTSYLHQKGRNCLQTFQTLIFRAITFVKFHQFSNPFTSYENTPFLKTANTDDVINHSNEQNMHNMLLKINGQYPNLTTYKISLLYHVYKQNFEPYKR